MSDHIHFRVFWKQQSLTEKKAVVTKKFVPIPRPPFLYPQRLLKETEEGKYRRFTTMLKQLSINVPLIEALDKNTLHAMFMNDMVKIRDL